MASQAQPIIPVTMPYGGGYGGGQLGHQIHSDGQWTRDEIRHDTDEVRNDLNRNDNFIRSDVQYKGDQVKMDVNRNADFIRTDIRHDSDQIKDNQRWDTEFTRRDIGNSVTESRQEGHRNTDYITKQAQDNAVAEILAIQNTSTQGLLATQNTSTQGLLATQNAATAVQLGVQQTSTDIKTGQASILASISSTLMNGMNLSSSNFQALAVQNEKNTATIAAAVLTQSQAALLGQKDREVNASNQFGSVQLLAQQNFQSSQLAQARDTAASQLQAAQYNKSAELQASMYKGYLENHITKTSSDTILAGFKNTAEILEKLCECCCENKMAHASTQAVVVQSGANNSANIQQGQYNSLTQQLAQANQDSLLAKIAAMNVK